MKLFERVRAVGGLLAIVVLLGLFIADFWFKGRTLNQATIMLLLSMIGALLGIDMARERLPIELNIGKSGENNE